MKTDRIWRNLNINKNKTLVNSRIWQYYKGMKRICLLIVVLLFAGMTIFAQSADMSFYIEEYNRTGATVFELLDILRIIRSENHTGIGDFYHNAITVFVRRLPNFSSNHERVAVEEVSRLIFQGLGEEKHNESAAYVWNLVQYFDIASPLNEGFLMYEGLVTLGQIDAKQYATNIGSILGSLNERVTTDLLAKNRIQRVALGCINALEALHEPVGVKPVFYATVGWYDNEVKAVAVTALHSITEAIGDAIGEIMIEIMRDPFSGPSVKSAAWQEMLHTQASDEVKARVAAVALEMSYTPTSIESQIIFRAMRISAIDTIRVLGVKEDFVYPFLERTYREAFDRTNTDFEVIILVVRTLSAVKTDEAVDLLTEFLRRIHTRRRSGPWGTEERNIMNVLIRYIAETGTQSTQTIQMLTVIQTSSNYTAAEQGWARTALATLSRR